MALEGFQPIVLRTFGGLCTSIDRLSLGPGLSPNCQNVRFDPGTVGSRYGYAPLGTSSPLTSSTPIHALKYYDPPITSAMILTLTSESATTGTLGYRSVSTAYASPTTLLAGLGNLERLTMKADSVLGALYIAISNGSTYAPNGVFISGVTRTLRFYGGLDSTPTTPRQIAPGPPAWVADASHYVKAAAGAGGLAVGDHYYAWLFTNKEGYITAVGGGGYFNVPDAANTYVEYKNAPLGPENTTSRILAIGAVGDVNLFWVPNKTVLLDNTTHTGTLPAFSETELITIGEPTRSFVTVHTPGAPEGVASYADRLVLWGVQAKSEWSYIAMPSAIGTAYTSIGLQNIDFKGGYLPDAPTMPGGWAALGAGSTGFALSTAKNSLVITNPTLNHGISVTGTIDNVYIPPGCAPIIRVRSRWKSIASDGAIQVTLVMKDTSGATIAVPQPEIILRTGINGSTDFRVVSSGTSSGLELVSLGPPPITGASATLTVKCTGAFADPTNWCEIDWIEICDAKDYSWQSTLRLSRSRDPETFDYATGNIVVAPDDGEKIRSCFRLRDALYVAKDRSLYVTRDTGDEPAAWPVDLVDKLSGTPAIHGVGYGDGWVAIAGRAGLVIFDGATPQLVSQEITPTWNTIDWTDPCFTWVVVDPTTKQIKIGARIAKSPLLTYDNDLLLTLDYTEGFGNPVPSGMGRKWSIDTVQSSKAATTPAYHHGTTIIDPTGKPVPVYSMTATPNGGTQLNCITYQDSTLADVYKWNDFPDIGVAGQGPIYATYETAPVGPELGRATFDRLVLRARGSGYMTVSFVEPDATTQTVGASSPALTSTPSHDIELRSNAQETSVGIRMNMASRSDWFVLRRIGLFLKDATYGEFRGKQDHAAS